MSDPKEREFMLAHNPSDLLNALSHCMSALHVKDDPKRVAPPSGNPRDYDGCEPGIGDVIADLDAHQVMGVYQKLLADGHICKLREMLSDLHGYTPSHVDMAPYVLGEKR